MIKIVLVRHGESTWNREGKFTGWTDVPLSEKGVEEAKKAGSILRKEGYSFDIAFTSVLKRAIDTLTIMLKEMCLNVPIRYAWQLNERHYGALQGLNKKEMTLKYGEEQVHKWRRGFAIQPPVLEMSDLRYPGNDPLYRDVEKKQLPLTESMKDTIARVVPYWTKEIVPLLKSGKRIIIASHGNTMRALMKYLDHIPDEKITDVNVPTGFPLVYELDAHLKPIKSYYLGDPEEIKAATEAVKNQAKAS
jgi:2,3-bisphosphoglycerate-dependent phosphoglycerate mutase